MKQYEEKLVDVSLVSGFSHKRSYVNRATEVEEIWSLLSPSSYVLYIMYFDVGLPPKGWKLLHVLNFLRTVALHT